ncbi:MAG: carbohydrate ABC transporter permease [Chloroflexi bacterium]|nr:carbohydrate ABC transporter permease [Chloroflexota bacterium]
MTITTNKLPKISLNRVLIYSVLILGALASVTPFIYMVMTAFKTYGSATTNVGWPWAPFGDEPLQWINFTEAVETSGKDTQWQTFLFIRYFANSVITSVIIVAGTVITSVLAAYALTHINLPGRNLIFMLILATIMVPNDLTLVPKVVMMFNLKWYNTYLALTVPFLASVFGIFLIRQFFLQIPKDLFDAARMDGAGHLRYLITIVVPLSKPAIVTTALLNFIWAWDNFKWPLLVTRDSNMRVLAVGLQQFLVSEGGTKVQLMMAFAAMVVVPIVVFYFFTQKYFTEGVITTGIKG